MTNKNTCPFCGADTHVTGDHIDMVEICLECEAHKDYEDTEYVWYWR